MPGQKPLPQLDNPPRQGLPGWLLDWGINYAGVDEMGRLCPGGTPFVPEGVLIDPLSTPIPRGSRPDISRIYVESRQEILIKDDMFIQEVAHLFP